MKAQKRNNSSDIVPNRDLAEFKKFLGQLATGYSDPELRRLQHDMNIAAEVLLDMYLANTRRFTKPIPTAHFDT